MDRKRQLELAAAAGCQLELVPMMGDFVPSEAPLIQVEGDDGRLDRAAAVPDIQGIGSGADVAAAPGAVEGAAR